MTGAFDPLAPAWLTVDLAAVGDNYDLFRRMVAPGCAVAGVIKADAYGLGVDQVLAALENRNCPFYFVATPEEGLHVRKLTRKPVAVLGGLYRGAEGTYVHENLIPVLNSLDDIAVWTQETERRGIKLPAILHFDTGMNRLGLGPEDTNLLLAEPDRLKGVDVRLIMSHLACADEKNHPMTEEQNARFESIAAHFPGVKKSLCNSSGAFRLTEHCGAMIRPGMALYGLNPTPEAPNPMRPVVTLHARVLQTRSVKRGETAGYGAAHRFENDTATATVALGYADGFLRSLSRGGVLYFNGAACPVVGRVSMDLVIVDVGQAVSPPRPGDALEVIGPNQDADALASAAGTIGYEILTALGRRYRRVYASGA